MSSYSLASLLHSGTSLRLRRHSRGLLVRYKMSFSSSATATVTAPQTSEQLLVVVGGGAAGIYASIIAKKAAPHLNVLVVEKGKLLSKDRPVSTSVLHSHQHTHQARFESPLSHKVKISGGGRCNVTHGHLVEKKRLADNYPRGNKELRGYFFDIHGPEDTMRWFCDHGVELKTEEDGRVFPVSNSSASVVDCLLHEAKRTGVSLQTGKVVSHVSANEKGKFCLKIERRTADCVEYVEADYALIATGSSKQGYALAIQLGHSIVEPMPSLFTFKIDDTQLACLSGITFPKVKAKLKLESTHRSIPELSQVGPMLVTHWGLSGPVILRLSAWGARDLFLANYTGILSVDFLPEIHIEDVKHVLFQHKEQFAKQKPNSSFPSHFGLVKRFWKYLLDREGLDGDTAWASIPSNLLNSVALLLKQCPFKVAGKGQFKDEFVTAGGVPLSEVSMNTMESRIRPNIFFAGEVLNIDGITGGFNFQNAWTGGYIAGTRIGELASSGGTRHQ